MPHKLILDPGLQRIITTYAQRIGDRGHLFCIEYEKLSYDSLQLALFSAGDYVPIIEFIRPNAYAEFDNKLVLIDTGEAFLTPGSSYHDTYLDGFYQVVCNRVLGQPYTKAQFENLNFSYGNYDPPTWRIILDGSSSHPTRAYTVIDSFALRRRAQPLGTIKFIPPPN
ncbi:hypothetical protein [Hymenobacter persicinus]|nr:hypothetical protein [Hymenobacter persicinus]